MRNSVEGPFSATETPFGQGRHSRNARTGVRINSPKFRERISLVDTVLTIVLWHPSMIIQKHEGACIKSCVVFGVYIQVGAGT